MKTIKIMAAILASGAIFFGGCGSVKPPVQQNAPVQNSESDSEREQRLAERHRAMAEMEYGYPVDAGIEVTRDEMDRFIDVAKNYKLTEGEVRRLVQIFKQVGMNFDSRLRIKIEPLVDRKIKFAYGSPIEYTIRGYTVNCDYPGTKPQLFVDGLPRNAAGQYVLSYGQTPDGSSDFEIYFEFVYGDALCPIYKDKRIMATVKDLSCAVDDSVFERMENEIAQVAAEKGKFVEVQKFFERTLARPITPEEYADILNGADPKNFGIEELENVTFRGVDMLKRTAQFTFMNGAPSIVSFPDVIVESNVYGEGKKKFHGNFKFRQSGALIKYKLWESSQKVN